MYTQHTRAIAVYTCIYVGYVAIARVCCVYICIHVQYTNAYSRIYICTRIRH